MNRFSVVAFSGVSCVLGWAYFRLISNIDRNSSLILQTIDNIESTEYGAYVTGKSCKVLNDIVGDMNQRKGLSNVKFFINCSKGIFNVQVRAHREKLDWKTDSLEVFQGEQPIMKIV